MGKLIHTFAVSVLALAAPARGQSADSVKPEGIVPAKTGATSPAASASVAPVSENPSRYAGADASQYVESLSSVFAIRARAYDPFGLPQNPDAKPPKPKIMRPAVAKYVAEVATPFTDIIRAIRVTAVMPGEKRFLVGDRNMSRGDRFPIRFRDKSIRVQIVDVTSAAIQFRNLDTGEAAQLKLDVLPQGMSKGDSGILVPGMRPNRPDAPLEIEEMRTGPPRAIAPAP